ncbi:DUF559 domain-containing protein [Micromonospora sp. WMMD980]|uniref:endonuclease domain-containing protein n=1 Tax=Micromonospora sp. WMMD980 TaxID=3016088 RepID=UPI00241604C5|nr:DUF559 domain-containing protein [Micromonospora sp. WMMD980]MDG4804678.1 DUF559 domain-containing protein [Micromonospora sp. WMMD980]
MSTRARVPRDLSAWPFRASRAVAEGRITRRMLRGPTWVRLLPDVYVHRDAHRADDHRMWCEAVALRLPAGAVVAGRSAAWLFGVDLITRNHPVTVLLPTTARLRPHPRLSIVRSPLPDEDHTRFAGLPVTTTLRTAFDLGRQGPRVEALVAVNALLRRRVMKLPALRDYAAARPGWPGSSLLREVLTLAEPLSESPMETRLRLLLLDAGLGALVAQHEVRHGGRFVARVDLAWPALRIAVEYDGDHHRERAQFRRDVARLNALRAAGWIVLRFTADDVLRRPEATVALVRQALAERRTIRSR